MRKILGISVLCALCLLRAIQPSCAQEKKIVSGHITNSSDEGKPISDVIIFAYNTVAEAEDAYNALIEARRTKGYFNAGYVIEAYPDLGGYYEVLVPETGALLFYTGIADPVLEKVNYRLEINVSFALNIMLESSKITAGTYGRMVRKPPVMRGNTTVFPVTYRFPAEEYGKSNARLVKQSSLTTGSTGAGKTEFFPPIVHDGKEYHRTQLRRMNYEGENDPLYMIAEHSEPLSDSLVSISWVDSVNVSSTDSRNRLKWELWVEDYNRVVYADSGVFRTDRIVRPMQFLEFPSTGYDLDPARFMKKPRRERRNVAGDISLTFLIGEARFDPSDTANEKSMEKLRAELTEAVTDEGSSLKEFHIDGTSSPDGIYYKNLNLAKKRMAYAMDRVTSFLPKNIKDRVYMTSKASVEPWSAVVSMLEKDSLMTEASRLGEIIKANEGKPDSQFKAIRSLPYYRTVIVPYLQSLRKVRYSFVTEVYRELTPEEIYSVYMTDKEAGLEREYALYEYWHLFNMVEDKAELEKLYRKACEVSVKTEAKPWALPVNNLAVIDIQKGVADTTYLSEFLDLRFPCDYVIRDMNRRTEELVNPSAAVANMTVMCLMLKDYERAYELSSMLPSSYDTLKAAAWCMAGNYDDSSDEGSKYYKLMRRYSPLNRVVMNLASGNIGLAKVALKSLPADDPVTRYISVQIMCYGKPDASASMDFETYEQALENLLYCFKADASYIDMAERDYMISEDLYREAKRQYEIEYK